MTTNVTLEFAPAGMVQLSSMDGINALAALNGGVIFTFSHMINSTLESIDYCVPYAGAWYFYNSETTLSAQK